MSRNYFNPHVQPIFKYFGLLLLIYSLKWAHIGGPRLFYGGEMQKVPNMVKKGFFFTFFNIKYGCLFPNLETRDFHGERNARHCLLKSKSKEIYTHTLSVNVKVCKLWNIWSKGAYVEVNMKIHHTYISTFF